jgi:glycerol-3-phosphate acyltransferase PlsY
MLELGVKVLLSYLLGALNGSLVIGKFSGVDIRSVGSGNAGGTNALRTQGRWFAFFVMVIDIGKGWLSAALLPGLELPGVPLDPAISTTWLMLACGGAAVVGHCYPVWFDFAGGKGMATAIGVMSAVAPGVLLPAAIVFVAVLVLTGFVGLATMASVTSMSVYLAFTDFATRQSTVLFLVLLALFIIFTHRSNIRRILDGNEHRVVKAMLFRR